MIAYILHSTDGPESGVFKKITDQSKQWMEYGADVRLFILTRKGFSRSFLEKTRGVPAVTFEYGNIAERLMKPFELYSQVVDSSPDIVYQRYDLYHPAFERLARRIPVIMEINSDDVSEFRLGNRLRHWYNYLTRRHVLLNVKGLIFESHQLAASPHFASYGKPHLVIGNSINLQRFAHMPAPGNSDPVLVFIGSPGQSWHGIDKIFWLARSFRKWKFHLVGPASSGLKDIPRNVLFHGFLDQSRYECLIAEADVALGPLSLYLIGKNESSPLKVREYLAYGLPTIIAYQDTDFPEGAPFLLQIPNRSDNVMVDAPRIERFVNSWRGQRVPRAAIEFLDVRQKEKTRFDFLLRLGP